MVGSFGYWKSLGISVRKGESGIAVLVPGSRWGGGVQFQTGYLFDVGQTDAAEGTKEELIKKKNSGMLRADPDRVFEAVRAAAEAYNIRIELSAEKAAGRGARVYPKDGLAYIYPDNPALADAVPSMSAASLAYILLYRKEKWNKKEMLLQADIVRYMIFCHYGMDTGGIGFEGLSEPEIREMKPSAGKKLLEGAFETAGRMIRRMDEYLAEKGGRQPDPEPYAAEQEGDTRPPEKTEEKSGPGLEAETAGGTGTSAGAEAEKETPAGHRPEDFGQKIGGARKDLWKGRGLDLEDMEGMNEGEAARYVTKDNIWEKPDYGKLMEEGASVRAAFFIKEVRNALPVKAVYSYKDDTPEKIRQRQEAYIRFIRDMKEMLLKVKTDTDIRNFFETFVNDGTYVEREGSYLIKRTEKGFPITDKLVKAMQMGRAGFGRMDHKIEKEQFGLPPEKKLPRGYQVRYLAARQEYVVVKGGRVAAEGIKSEQEAREKAEELHKTAAASRKRHFVPKQLEQIRRDGPSCGITPEHPADGNLYMEEFGFRGGEFGNWMSGADRQASLDMGYDAFCDLASALGIEKGGVSLGGRLAIAFGARGQGGHAAAHYEPMREVVNLTKLKGAGSLAHEWGHAFDDIAGKRLGLSGFLTACAQDERAPESVRELLAAMKYRPSTAEELEETYQKSVERSERALKRTLDALLPEQRMDGAELLEWEKKKREVSAQIKEKSRTETYGDEAAWIEVLAEEIGSYRKKLTGRELERGFREQLCSAIYRLACTYRRPPESRMAETDFYKNSLYADGLCSKERNGYWQSSEEMFARAFACYVKDRLPWRSDYLCGHAETSVFPDVSGKEPGIRKAYPEGEERKRINECFDRLIADCKRLGLFGPEKAERKMEETGILENGIWQNRIIRRGKGR